METREKKVFLSHASKNFEVMKEIADYLEGQNIPCWYAPRDIPAGENYDLQIAVVLEEMVDVIIVLITEDVAQSTMVPKEIVLGFNNEIKVIPLMVDGSPVPKNLEFLLCNVQWIDGNELDQLVGAIEMVYERSNDEKRKEISEKVKKPVVIRQNSSSLYQIESIVREKVQTVFEPPTSLVDMENVLINSHILYLFNSQSVGKYTTAIALLNSRNVKEIFEWSKEMSLRDIVSHPIKKNSGFVVEVESANEFFKNLSDHELERYSKKLIENHTYLILIAKSEAGLELLQNYSIKVDQPEYKNVLSNHIHWHYFDADQLPKMLNWLDSEKAVQLLNNELLPRYADNHVQTIYQIVTGELEENTIIDSLDTNVRRRVKSWFQQTYSIRDLAFYLTAGMFQGHSYNTIIVESKQLEDLFYGHIGRNSVNESLMPSRDDYLQQFHTEVRPVWKQTNVGSELFEGVYFLIPRDIQFIWEYVWLQYPSYQKPIIEWLQNLLKKPSRHMESRAVDIIVHLAKRDSENVRNQLISPWANSTNYKERLQIARVLREIAKDDDFIHSVFLLMKSWILQRNNGRLQWTGLAVMGPEVGVAYYSQSLALLKEVYENTNDKRLLFSIQRSFEQLSQLVGLSSEYESIFFSFWIDWFRSLNEKPLVKVLQFSHTIFQTQHRLFFKTQMEWQEKFWFDYIRTSIANYKTRQSMERLLEQWISLASGNVERQIRISKLYLSVYLSEQGESQQRMEWFIEKGLSKNEELYGPISELLKTL